MSLERNGTGAVRESAGFSFTMRISGTTQNVRVWVSDEVLDDKDVPLNGEALRAAFEFDKHEFENLASYRHSHGRVSSAGQIEISAGDIAGIIG